MSLSILDEFITTLADAPVRQVCVGAFWTAVVVEVDGQLRCGLAASLRGDNPYHSSGPAVADAGHLTERSALELAGLGRSEQPIETSIGMATVNALLPRHSELWGDGDAADVIIAHGAGKSVALVGHFPFVPRVREKVGRLWVLEQQPQGEDLPAEAAPEVIPQAAVLAITATTLMNGTFEDLMALRRPDAVVMLVGPSTPLAPRLFDYGVHLLSGAVVEDVEAVLRAVSQGANFRQLRRHGVRLVTMQRAGAR